MEDSNPREPERGELNDIPDYLALPDYLESTYAMLRCAYPDGIGEDEYWAMLVLLYDFISPRSIARVVSKISEKHWSLVLNDVGGMEADSPPSSDLMDQVKRRLISCGYDQWATTQQPS